MHQRIQNQVRVTQSRRDENLVDLILRGARRPTLPDMPALDIRTGKTAGHMALGHGVASG